ncbi:MAG: hypothetical protein PHH61_01930 [Candidatus Nanoarchaeia archaeon]|nr:hypothetical protein [Candidatus Nanoarchaeia archaeon]
MSKAQGLPINFIVLAAIAILILILAVGFVIGGGISFTSAISPATFSANCKQICANYQRTASTVDFAVSGDTVAGQLTGTSGFSLLLKTDKYCVSQDIQGGTSQSCASIEPCFVIFKNSVQKQLKCQP